MDPITLLLLGGSALYLFNKKSKNSPKIEIVPKEIKGFEINKNCNNIIIYDIKKAKQWLLNSIKKEHLPVKDITKMIFGNCSMDDILPTNKNYLFLYDVYSYVITQFFMNKELSFDDFLMLYVALNIQYSTLTLILQEENIDIGKFKKPISLLSDKWKKELNNRRGYTIDNCIIEVEDNLKMGMFGKKISKWIPPMGNIDVNYHIFYSILSDQCEELDDFSHKVEYDLVKEFFHGQLENGSVSLTEANAVLSEWIEEYVNQGLDVEDLMPLSPTI